jgi:UDP-N-acetylmuramate--alanine ligase
MNINNIKKVYFLGIGGIGMSALARYFRLHGCYVSGYDKTKTLLTTTLENEGIDIHYIPNPESIPQDVDLVVYTPAVSTDNPEWKTIVERNSVTMKRAEVLGLISNSGKCLAIAGTHGKTTTSAILAHIFKFGFGEVNAFVGGIISNYKTNFLYADQSDYFVVEADEFDRSFLHLQPQIAVINSIDADHLDIYGEEASLIRTFQDFTNNIRPNGILILNSNIPPIFKLEHGNIYTFGIETDATFVARNLRIIGGNYMFDLYHPDGRIQDIVLTLPGKHNVENTIAASAIALMCGMEEEVIKEAISEFKGVKRRFEITRKANDIIYVDDYAHHPTEISRVLESAREMYVNRKLSVIFQPHLYSRTRDFEIEFAEVLSGFDEVILLDIYPARELPIEGVTSERLLQKIKIDQKQIIEKSKVMDYLKQHEFEVLFTLGAGDIDTLVDPIKELIVA